MVTLGIDNYLYASCNRCPANANYEGCHLGPLLADANGIGLPSNTSVVYVDIVTSCGESATGFIARCDVVVVGECMKPTAVLLLSVVLL